MEEQSRVIRTIRMVKWECVKGELNSILATYWNNENYGKMDEEVKRFIKYVDDNGLVE